MFRRIPFIFFKPNINTYPNSSAKIKVKNILYVNNTKSKNSLVPDYLSDYIMKSINESMKRKIQAIQDEKDKNEKNTFNIDSDLNLDYKNSQIIKQSLSLYLFPLTLFSLCGISILGLSFLARRPFFGGINPIPKS